MKHDFNIKYNGVFLRPLEERDLELIRSWRNRDEIRKWFIDSRAISKEQQVQWFLSYLKKENDFMFIIEDIVSGTAVGTVALYNLDIKNLRAEFGRLIIGNYNFRNKGIAKKAAKALCKLGFQKMNLKEIYLEVLYNNKAAIKVYKNIGFKRVYNDEQNKNEKIMYMTFSKVGDENRK